MVPINSSAITMEYGDDMDIPAVVPCSKIRKTLTLDADLVEIFSADPGGLSAAVNSVLRTEQERRVHAAEALGLDGELESLSKIIDERMADPAPGIPIEDVIRETLSRTG